MRDHRHPRDAARPWPPAVHSLHQWRGPHEHHVVHSGHRDDRLLVGLVSGAVLFYLVGKALGLGRGGTARTST